MVAALDLTFAFLIVSVSVKLLSLLLTSACLLYNFTFMICWKKNYITLL